MAANEDRKLLRQARKQLGIKRQEIAAIRAEIKELVAKVQAESGGAAPTEVEESSVS